jgi:antitoxin component YwqK of YwqJK toxin-antitoxin module
MKLINSIIFGMLFLVSCSEGHRLPKYHEFSNDWERENLFGEVKELMLFQASILDPKTNTEEEAIKSYRLEFTDFGKIAHLEHYDRMGHIRQYQKNLFNEKRQMVESSSANLLLPVNSFETFQFDDSGNQIFSKSISNDSSEIVKKFLYDAQGNQVMRETIQNNDTTRVHIFYDYDGNGKMLRKRQETLVGKELKTQTGEYQYDKKGNLIKSINRSEIFDYETSFKYSPKNIIRKIEYYENGQMNREIFFDKHFNPVLVKYYRDNELVNEMKYKYRFDRIGNWVWRKLYLREMLEKGRKFQPVLVETRMIGYYP